MAFIQSRGTGKEDGGKEEIFPPKAECDGRDLLAALGLARP